MRRPLVSVITNFLNGAQFIQEAIESVCAQTYDSWELLLVDDGSTDSSTEIALEYAAQYPSKIRYLEHEGHQNRGTSAARNLGLRHAKGEYIAFLDADDVWLPYKLERQVAILASQPRAAMVYGATQYWYSWTGHPEDRQHDYVPDLGVEADRLFEPPALLTLLYPLGKAPAPCPCGLLVRRETVESVGGFEEDFRGMYDDQAFLVKVYLKHAVFVSSACCDKYRIHPNSCVSVAKQTGQYHEIRLFFLNWLETYLAAQGFQDTPAWLALQEALCPYRHPMWWLRVAPDNAAHLVFPPNSPETVRIEITKATTQTSFDIQLNQPRLQVKTNQPYTVCFQARADHPRSIFVGFARAHVPWTGLGLYSKIELTTEWQSFTEDFVATADETNARILFDVGDSDIAVEVSAVSLHHRLDGKAIAPGPAPVQTGNPERDKVAWDRSSGTWQRAVAASDPSVRQPIEQAAAVQFGTLRRITPVSQNWGLDRGLPIDRYYVEHFLARHAQDLRGRVLEIEDDMYTRRFGSNCVTSRDVLHVVEGNPRATIVGDLTCAEHIPSHTFDCIILTQTLHLIYDTRAALHTLHRILKPGGILLATFPGITRISHQEWSDSWFWGFKSASARRLFEEVFAAADVKVQTHGNVLTAVAFLHGLAVEELQQEELDHCDPDYEVLITVRAVKKATL
jgi:glycosyltransferase involved in cell wall biosynthesis/SAM-dependent methyltransferase